MYSIMVAFFKEVAVPPSWLATRQFSSHQLCGLFVAATPL